MDRKNDSYLKRKALEKQKQDIMEFQILMRKSSVRLIGWENREEVCQRLIREINSLLENINNTQWKEIEEFQRVWQRDVLYQKVMKSPKKSKSKVRQVRKKVKKRNLINQKATSQGRFY